MRANFVETAVHRLDSLDEIITSLWDDRARGPDLVGEFLGSVHSLKGTGGTFGYPHFSMVCHHLESYMVGLTEPDDAQLDDIQAFIDRLRDCLDIWPAPPDEEVQGIVRSLPGRETAPADEGRDDDEPDPEVILVSQAASIRQLAEFYFKDFGCNVVTVTDAFEGFRRAIEEKPDLVVASVVMEGLSGVDLIDALKATRAMGGGRFALLSSTADVGDMAGGIPDGAAVIPTEDMETGIERALDALGL